MIPKGKLAGLLVVFVAIGLITATGAFTTVSAQRTATVRTAGDSAALLALRPAAGQNGDHYAGNASDTLELYLDGSHNDNSNAQGVNLDALTEVDSVFTITNQGTQPVDVWITKNGTNADLVTFYNGTHTVDRTALESQGKAQNLDVGQSVTVSMSIDTRGSNLDEGAELLHDITIHAEAASS